MIWYVIILIFIAVSVWSFGYFVLYDLFQMFKKQIEKDLEEKENEE